MMDGLKFLKNMPLLQSSGVLRCSSGKSRVRSIRLKARFESYRSHYRSFWETVVA